jgi:hypothetical protein
MANNRVALYCPVCGKRVILAKTMASGSYYRTGSPVGISDEEDLGDAFLDFLSDHYWCGESMYAVNVELRFEDHPDKAREY